MYKATYKTADAKPKLNAEQLIVIERCYITSANFRILRSSTLVRNAFTGKLIACYLRGHIPLTYQTNIYRRLRRGAKHDISNRRTLFPHGVVSHRASVTGKVLTSWVGVDLEVVKAAGGKMGVAGFEDCRASKWNEKDPVLLTATTPLLNQVTHLFEDYLPAEFCQQLELMANVKAEHRLVGSTFTSFIVNRTVRTRLHVDEGDLEAGYAAIVVDGQYQGGELLIPEFQVGFDLQPGDCLFFDPHLIHGNNVLEGERLATVLYSRTDLTRCGA